MRARAIQFVCALKKQMQLGFHQYVNHRRISYALRLIEEGHDSVRDIAAACGFSDALYFSKVFKKKSRRLPKREDQPASVISFLFASRRRKEKAFSVWKTENAHANASAFFLSQPNKIEP